MIKRFDHIAIFALDQEKSINYYKKLGFETGLEYPIPSGNGKIYELKSGDVRVMLVPANTGAPHGMGHMAFLVDDVNETYMNLKEKVKFSKEPTFDPEYGRTNAVIEADPNGVQIQIVSGGKKD